MQDSRPHLPEPLRLSPQLQQLRAQRAQRRKRLLPRHGPPHVRRQLLLLLLLLPSLSSSCSVSIQHKRLLPLLLRVLMTKRSAELLIIITAPRRPRRRLLLRLLRVRQARLRRGAGAHLCRVLGHRHEAGSNRCSRGAAAAHRSPAVAASRGGSG